MEPQKEIKVIEKTIASLDGQRKVLQTKLENASSSAEADRLQQELDEVALKLAEAEDRWSELFAIVEGF
jgi:ATP-binding cassette subfamily F protein 3